MFSGNDFSNIGRAMFLYTAPMVDGECTRLRTLTSETVFRDPKCEKSTLVKMKEKI